MTLKGKMEKAELSNAAKLRPAAARFSREQILEADGGCVPPTDYDYPRGFYKFGRQFVGPGESVKRHTGLQAEFYLFIAGRGKMFLAGETFEVGEGDVVYLPHESERGVSNDGDSELEYIWVGIPFVEQ